MAGKHRRSRHPSSAASHPRARHRKPKPASHTVVPVLTGVAAIIAAGVIIGQNLDHGQASHGGVVAQSTAPAFVPPVAAATAPIPHASVLATSTSRPQAPAALRFEVHRAPHHPAQQPPAVLTLRTLDAASYVQVRASGGALLVRKILPGHHRLSFRRHGLAVVLGNAGAVRVAVDGRHAHRAGRSGQVVRFTVR